MFPSIFQRTHSSHSVSRLIRRTLLLLLTLSLPAGTLAAQNDKDTPVLEPGKPIERELVGDVTHSYRITLAANQFLHVVVEQKGIDVVLRLFAPDGKQLIEVDSPNGTQGPEPVSVVAETAGSYRLEVRSLEKDAAAGRYEVKIAELRAATERDVARVNAENIYREAAVLHSQGTANSWRAAIEKFERTLPLWTAAGDSTKELETLLRIASIYGDSGGFPYMGKAITYMERALLIAQKENLINEKGVILSVIGDAYHSLGENQRAIEFQNRALPLIRAAGNPRFEAAIYKSLGDIYSELGEVERAISYYELSLKLSIETQDVRGQYDVLVDIAGSYQSLAEDQKRLSNHPQSLSHYRQSLSYHTRALKLVSNGVHRASEARTLNNIAEMHHHLGERQKALEFIDQALAVTNTLKDQSKAVALNNIGGTYEVMGEKRKAADMLQQALDIARKEGILILQGGPLNNLGRIHFELKEYQKAVEHYQQAVAVWHAVGERRAEIVALLSLASIEKNRNEFSKALKHVAAALKIVESVRSSIASPDTRASYVASLQPQGAYEEYIDLLMQMHKRKPSEGYDGTALQASERARARSLLETLAEANADIRQGVDPALLERERSLQNQLNDTAQQQMKVLGGKHTEQEAVAIAKELDRLTTEFQQVEAEIRQKSPRYAELTQPRILNLREIQTEVLDRDTLLLEYSLGEERSYLWAVTQTAITSYELPKRAEVEAAARQFYNLLSAADNQPPTGGGAERRGLRSSATEAASAEAGARLSRMLLAPVAAQLGGKRLVIVSDGALQYVPFAALPAPRGQEFGVESPESKDKQSQGRDSKLQASDSAPPLIVGHEVVNLPSASTLAVLRGELEGRKPAPKSVAVLADPVFEGDDTRIKADSRQPGAGLRGGRPVDVCGGSATPSELAKVARSGRGGERPLIKRLPCTRREAEQILSLVAPAEGRKALDFEASRATATSDELGQYRYVHFATHGLLDSQHPELSGVVLSLFDEQGREQDGFLRAHEVFNLKIPADVVTLSACQTGLGKEIRGEGLVSLTRAFMYAGAPRVVVSLWDVDDAATAELMTRFYRGMLKEGLRPAKALQAAQVSMLGEKRFASPYFWAAFTLQGEWR